MAEKQAMLSDEEFERIWGRLGLSLGVITGAALAIYAPRPWMGVAGVLIGIWTSSMVRLFRYLALTVLRKRKSA